MGNIIFLFKAFAGSFKWFNVFVFQDEHPGEPARELSTWTVLSVPLGLLHRFILVVLVDVVVVVGCGTVFHNGKRHECVCFS